MIDEKKLIESSTWYPNILFKEELTWKDGWNNCNRDWIKRIEEQPKAGQWIPCSERLPVPNEYDETGEFFKAYLVQTKSNRMHTALWDGTYWTIWTRGIVIDKVIAWMPLPEPYKEQNNG